MTVVVIIQANDSVTTHEVMEGFYVRVLIITYPSCSPPSPLPSSLVPPLISLQPSPPRRSSPPIGATIVRPPVMDSVEASDRQLSH